MFPETFDEAIKEIVDTIYTYFHISRLDAMYMLANKKSPYGHQLNLLEERLRLYCSTLPIISIEPETEWDYYRGGFEGVKLYPYKNKECFNIKVSDKEEFMKRWNNEIRKELN